MAPTQPQPRGTPIGPCPIPSGVVLFGELSSAFCDGQRLLRHLGERRHTGAIIGAVGDRIDVVMLLRGEVLGAIAATTEGTVRLDRVELPALDTQPAATMTVITYRPAVVAALGRMMVTPPLREPADSGGVDVVLARLAAERGDAAVRVVAEHDVGVVLVSDGAVLGAYTREAPELDDPDAVLSLGRTAGAEVNLHSVAPQPAGDP